MKFLASFGGLRAAAGDSRAPEASGARALRAFTLIELLVVIAIIAALAALIVGILPAATEKRNRARVKAELTALETAIDSYKETRGFYPPDDPNKPDRPPLFYELTATPSPDTNVMQVVNAGTPDSRSFYPTLKPSQIKPDPGNPTLQFLTVPVEGPEGQFNPWRYDSSSPVHNPESYDLWADVIIRGRTNIIGNWND